MAVRRPLGWAVCFLLLATFVGLAAPGVAGAQCPEAKPTYMSSCGPTFALPPWGDAGGWTDPSQYSTIQLADLNGDGKDELLARNDQGLAVWSFDTSFGQWRPQVDANDLPQALSDFRSPRPGETLATDWTKPEYYSTIHTANLDGQPGEEVFARFADGLHAYTYVPPPGGTSIDGGSWQRIGGAAGWSDAEGGADPGIYTTIQPGTLFEGSARYVIGRRQPTQDDPASMGQAAFVNGDWLLGGVLPGFLKNSVETVWNDYVCGQPACYLNAQAAPIATSVPDPSDQFQTYLDPDAELLSRTRWGLSAWTYTDVGGQWFAIGGTQPWLGPGSNVNLGPFADVPGPDCPFSSNGASGPGSADCLGTSPSYYETLRVANIDGRPGGELLARASDGLRVKRFNGTGYDSLATLTDLAGAAASVQPGEWGSIRTADINRDGSDEVLALDGTALQAWSYDPTANAWTKLQPSTSLTLTGDWLVKPEYFSTIQTGDVDGDGRDDVIARGPYGIRTWFYNRRGTGGWERYLPAGYQPFATPGRQAAFAELTAQAKDPSIKLIPPSATSVRDVWTAENAPSDLSGLQQGILRFAGCSGPNSGTPLSYNSCTPPAGSGVNADDWKTVINEVLAEIYLVQQVLDFYYGNTNSLTSLRQSLFISDGAALPAIGSQLELAAAAGNSANFNLQSFFAGAAGIAASIAGLVPAGGAEASAALWVTSELVSMLPSASQTATSTFQTTYDQLQFKFASIVQETTLALDSQSQQVRSDQPLLTLVAQLLARGTWTLDEIGMRSAANEAFSLWAYQELLPTIYERYAITNCTDQSGPGGGLTCQLPAGPYVFGNSDGTSTNGTWLSSDTGTPCNTETSPKTRRTDTLCDYDEPDGDVPDDLAGTVWGPVADTCAYQPGNAGNAWTFGRCSLGVPLATSIGADSRGWTFTTQTGNPVCCGVGAVRAVSGRVRASAARAGSSAQAPRDTLSPLRYAGRVHLPRGLRLRRMRVAVDRTLFEHGRREELARSGSGRRRLRPFTLRRVRGGLFTSHRRRGPRVRLQLRRLDVRGRAQLDLRLTRVKTRDIRALCGVLRASVSRAPRRLELETRLRLRDRTERSRITMRQRWRCVRDRQGEFTGIRPVKPRPLAARPGLALRIGAPRALASGRRATVLVNVANRRRARPRRVVSSLWDLRITGSAGGAPQTVRLKELRARRSRTLRLTVPVSRGSRQRLCVRVAATAPSARGAGARRCARSADAPPVTG